VGDQQLVEHAGLERPLRGVRTVYQHVTVAAALACAIAIALSIPSLRLDLTSYARTAEASTR
jgi:hypothetical protein